MWLGVARGSGLESDDWWTEGQGYKGGECSFMYQNTHRNKGSGMAPKVEWQTFVKIKIKMPLNVNNGSQVP